MSFRKDDSLRILKRENDSTRALVTLQQKRLVSKDSTIIDLQQAVIKGKDEVQALHSSQDKTEHERDAQTLDKNMYHNLYIQQKKAKSWIIVGFVALLAGIIAIK